MAKAKRTADFEIVTPSFAKKMLDEKNTHNRNLSPKALAHYVRQIQEGQWQANGETIKISEDGTLLDGQHRLMAIVETNKSLECLVVRGLSRDVMPTIDTGRGRTVADHLKLQKSFHCTNYIAVAAAIGIVWHFQKGKYVESRERITPAEAIAFLQQNPGMLKSSDATAKPDLLRLTTPSIAISCHYLFSKIDKFKAEEFFDKLMTGENLSKTSPILKLRVELLGMKHSLKRKGAVNRRVFLYYMVSAFEAFLRGRRIDGFEKMSVESVIELPKRGGG